MSKTTKRKHVTKEALDEYYVPEGEEEIVKVVAGKGNNLHEVECADGKKFLVSMPTKFRKNLWIKRGDFVVISPIKEGNKVQAEIVYVLYSKQIKYLQQQDLWPEPFADKETGAECEESSRLEEYNSSEDENDDLLFKNPNRREFVHVEDSESESSEDDDSDSDGHDDHIEEYTSDKDDINLARKNDVEVTNFDQLKIS